MSVVLRCEQIVVRRRHHRNGFDERVAGNERAAGVNAGLANGAVESFRKIEGADDERVVGVFFFPKLRAFRHCRIHCDFRLRGNEFREAICFRERQIQHACDVFNRHARSHTPESYNVRDVILPVFLRNPFENFAAPFVVEVNIDIGHRNTIRIQKALEKQIVFHRVYPGDSEAIGDNASGGAPAPGADENAHFACCGDKILNNEKVAREAHRFDGCQLKIDTFLRVFGNVPVPSFLCARHCQVAQIIVFEANAVNFFRTAEFFVTLAKLRSKLLFAQAFPQFGFRSEAFRNRENRHNRRRVQIVFFNFVGDFQRVEKDVRAIVKQRFHFRRCLKPFLPRVTKAVFVGNFFSGI